MKESKNVPTNLYNHFHTSLSENNKLYHKIPTYQEEEEHQIGSSVNNIMINDKDLNNGILRVRYLNNRKLTNNLLKNDYKISKNMVNAIKYNRDIHKLSKNEMKIYHEMQKFLNKEQDLNILIASYLSGNISKKFYGFEKKIFKEGYHRSIKTPNLDKTKFLKVYCNLVDNKEDNKFLTNVFIKNNISDQIIYENHNNYKRKKILYTSLY